jgi:Spy/CpxP family protein refolding chaperone
MMNGLLRGMLTTGLVMSVTTWALAADQAKEGKGKKKGAAAGQQVFEIPKEITLTDDQKAKLEAIKKEHGPKVSELTRKMDESLTDEQKKARKEAAEKAKADGKKRKDLQAEVNAAMKLTDEQKKKRDEVQPELAKLTLSVKEQIYGILTDEQKTHYKLPKGKKAK